MAMDVLSKYIIPWAFIFNTLWWFMNSMIFGWWLHTNYIVSCITPYSRYVLPHVQSLRYVEPLHSLYAFLTCFILRSLLLHVIMILLHIILISSMRSYIIVSLVSVMPLIALLSCRNTHSFMMILMFTFTQGCFTCFTFTIIALHTSLSLYIEQ